MMLKFVDFFKTWCQDVEQNFKVNPKAGVVLWRLIPIVLLTCLVAKLEEQMPSPGELLNNPGLIMSPDIIITIIVIIISIPMGAIMIDLIRQLVLDLAARENRKGFVICRWIVNVLCQKIYFNPFSIWIRIKFNRE